MFSSVGWGEILVLVIVGLIVVGPERLPRIINDVKAMILAARNAISSAKEELGDGFSEDFEDFRRPLAQINDVRRMGARGLVTKALLDDDPDFLRDVESTVRGVSGAVTGKTTGTGSAQGGQAGPTAGTAAGAGPTGTTAGAAAASGAGSAATAATGHDAVASNAPAESSAPSTGASGATGTGAGAGTSAGGAEATPQAASWDTLDDGDVL